MKKCILMTAIMFAALAASARPGHGGFRPGPPPMHHHHVHHSGGFAAGVIGGALVGGLIYDAIRPAPIIAPAPVVVPTPTVVVQQSVVQPVVVQQPVVQPVVVQQPVVQQPVVQQPVVQQPVYQTQNVWVEGRYVDQIQQNGTTVRVWQPGHYEQHTVQVN